MLSAGLHMTGATMCPLRYLRGVGWGEKGRFPHTIRLTQIVLMPLNFLTRVQRDFPRAFSFPKRETDLKGQSLVLTY